MALFDSESSQYVHLLDEVWIIFDFLGLLGRNWIRIGLGWAWVLGFGVLVGEVHVELFLHSEEEFLGVRPDLCSVSGPDEFLYFFPVFAVDLQTFVRKIHTEEKLLVFLFGPPAVGFWIHIQGLSHFGYWDNRIWILKFKYNRFRSKRFYTTLSKNSNLIDLKDIFIVMIFNWLIVFRDFQT